MTARIEVKGSLQSIAKAAAGTVSSRMGRRLADPDDTDGRALYRARADTLARAQIAMGKRTVKFSSQNRVTP